ncbi:ATP-binding cassette domain-containing protein [Pseudomonas sp. NPDC007930]|uniref:ABC transporter ATP-binding protein n=1 Tax=Pseudomonas sp. NPDC007930 TaxID=3364417 RepID=UPI0036E78792
MKPLLQTRGLTMRFGGLVALDGLDLHIAPREILALLGPNGSGKTTCFNVITGLYKASAGSVTFAGEDLSGRSPQSVYRHGITRTFQRLRLSLPLTVFDNVVAGNTRHLDESLWFNLFRRQGFKRQHGEMVERVHQLLHTFNAGLASKLWEPAANLSMLDRRRVEICRALISEPRLLLLDEPSAGMTHDETNELMDDVLKVRQSVAPFAIALIEHEMNLIQRISERCVVLNYGKKIAEGSYAEIIADPQVQVAYLGKE